MPRFIVRFIKDVLGDNGQMDEVCQKAIELDAPNGGEAEQQAKAQRRGLWRDADPEPPWEWRRERRS